MKNLPLERMLDAKVVATAITAAVAPLIVGLIFDLFGATVTVDAVVAYVGLPVLGLVTFGIGWLKRDPRVKALLDFYRRVTLEGNVEPGEPGEPVPFEDAGGGRGQG